jgi:hypothetical protein
MTRSCRKNKNFTPVGACKNIALSFICVFFWVGNAFAQNSKLIEQNGCNVLLAGESFVKGSTYRADGKNGIYALIRIQKVNAQRNRAMGRIFAGTARTPDKRCKKFAFVSLRKYDAVVKSGKKSTAFHPLELSFLFQNSTLKTENFALGESSPTAYAMTGFQLGARVFPGSYFQKKFPYRELGVQIAFARASQAGEISVSYQGETVGVQKISVSDFEFSLFGKMGYSNNLFFAEIEFPSIIAHSLSAGANYKFSDLDDVMMLRSTSYQGMGAGAAVSAPVTEHALFTLRTRFHFLFSGKTEELEDGDNSNSETDLQDGSQFELLLSGEAFPFRFVSLRSFYRFQYFQGDLTLTNNKTLTLQELYHSYGLSLNIFL